MNKNRYFIIVLLSVLLFTGCYDDNVDRENSIFDVETLSPKNEFDEWLYDNLTVPYNIEFAYKFDYMDSDFNYDLTPARFDIATQFTQIIKYCWFECYDEVAGMDFTRETCPKQIYLIGSSGIDMVAGTELLGTASGGLRVVLYKLNEISDFKYESTISYMHIMHHEFSHILDQKKMLDPAFGEISAKYYLGDMWVNHEEVLEGGDFYKVGFVSNYSLDSPEEDYAEVYSRYLTSTDAVWNKILNDATVFDDTGKPTDTYGRDTILKKLQFIREYLAEEWEIDIDELRESVQRRSKKAESLELLTFSEFVK